MRLPLAAALLLLLLGPPLLRAQRPPSGKGTGQASSTQRIVSQGIVVEFGIEPLQSPKTAELLEGAQSKVSFTITDKNTGQPLNNLHPTAWIDLRKGDPTADEKRCREKIQTFLQPSMARRPDVDLNTYFVLSLNGEPNISVIDPLSGFGGTKLFALIPLESPGEDWVMNSSQQRLFVTSPAAGKVSVIDTNDWKVTEKLDAGVKPARVALQHDEKYLWIANDGPDVQTSGVTALDVSTLKIAAHLNTGLGPHEITLTDDDRYAFISNKAAGTLSVIDVRKLTIVKEIKVGSSPTSLAFSSLSKAVYVINEGDGDIVAIDAYQHQILSRIKTRPGLKAIRLLPNGRFGLAVNQPENAVYVFDASTNKLLHVIPTGKAPDQISLTTTFAYVRSSGDEFVTMINLANLGKEGVETSVTRFPAGQMAPRQSLFTSVADVVVPAPEAGAVLVANPADKMIYYYMEGMAAPMGTFQNYRRAPKAVMVRDRSLRETSAGVYSATVNLPPQGKYDVAFLLDSPRVVNCFETEIKENPALTKQREIPIRIELVSPTPIINVGANYELRFRVFDTGTNLPRSELRDIEVLTFLAPGIWQERNVAKQIADRSYAISFVPPQTGVYYVFFQCSSLGVKFNQLQPFTLTAKERTETGAPAKPKSP